MIGPCMPQQRLDAAPAALAAVVQLTSYRERRIAVDIMDDCPGWHVWYSQQPAQWIAHRCGTWRSVDELAPRTYSVAAADPGGLRGEIYAQALLDMAAEAPEWAVTCTDDGFWWASWAGPGGDPLGGALYATSPVKLCVTLLVYVRLMTPQHRPDSA
jgi:hypothetical protein